MTVVLDAGPVIAFAERTDPMSEVIQEFILSSPYELVLSQLAVAEIDYMLASRLGTRASRAFLTDLVAGLYRVECIHDDEWPTLAALTDRYRDLGPGLADLSIVVLSRRFDTRRILTFDHRHFRAIEPLQGGSFELLPADLAPTSVD